jgi:proline iminopeptidase
MLKKLTLILLITLLIFSCSKTQKQVDVLWPPLEPYKTGYLKVSDLHEIYYQLAGNPDGKPVMFLHGGPGAGCMKTDFQYFNPDKYHIILHDQRASGLSKPFAVIEENTTWHLVDDIEKLRQHLNLDKVVLFGGSWGSTLALAYAEQYPQNVSGMILRGVFTSTQEEIDHFYHGGAGKFFPEYYQKLVTSLDNPAEKNYPAQLLEKLQSPDSLVKNDFAYAWARYEGKVAFLEISEETVNGWFEFWNPLAFSVIENYYMANLCFFEEGQLLNNADKLADIPVILVNGRYDLICPPINAYKLHKKLPKSKLYIVEKAGHSASEPLIQAKLVEAAKSFE